MGPSGPTPRGRCISGSLDADGTDCQNINADGTPTNAPASWDGTKWTDTAPSGCGTWTTLEFSKTVLRVGSPWKKCDSTATTATASASTEKGVILPAYFGHPNLEEDKYTKFAEKVQASAVPTYVVLDIFSPGSGAKVSDNL